MRLGRRAQSGGFTIIEVLVALTLLAAVILLVTRAFLTVLSVTSQGGRVTVATALAAKQLEAVRTRVEAQPDRTNWRNEFCAIAAQPTTAFAAPRPAERPGGLGGAGAGGSAAALLVGGVDAGRGVCGAAGVRAGLHERCEPDTG